MQLSIIIPIYNAAKYLSRCIQSIIQQGLSESEYEIILINDGSTDNSWEICQQLFNLYPNVIKLYNKANEGLGPTRQLGVELALGKYITFCDADDYLIADGYRYLFDSFILNNDTDVLCFYSKTVLEEHYSEEIKNTSIQGKIVYQGTGKDFYKNQRLTFVWNQIFKKEYLLQSNIKFKYLPMVEDVMFNLEFAMTNPQIMVVSANIYRYEHHTTSLIHNRNYKFLREAIMAYTCLLEKIHFFAEKNETTDKELYAGLIQYLNAQMIPFLSRILSSDYTTNDLKNITLRLRKNRIIPLKESSTRNKIINFILQTPSIFPICQWGYKNFFLKLVLPHINRTK